MEVALDVGQKYLVEVGERALASHISAGRLAVSLHPLQDLSLLLRLKQVGHLARVEDHADVLHEGLIFDLEVGEQEHNL